VRTALVVTGSVIAIAIAALLTGCGSHPSGPSEIATVGVELTGPRSVAPGGTARFTAIARFGDGTSRDVTAEAEWSSSNAAAVSVQAGVVTGHAAGEALLRVQLRSAPYYSSAREVIVVPDGTFRLVGAVSEADPPMVAIAGARVDVIAGSGAGLSATTGTTGQYRLYGVAAETQIAVSKDGYQRQLQTITVTDHQTQNFQLALLHPRDNVAGTYRLTVTAADTCSADLPAPARSRIYTAVLTQNGAVVDVRLKDAAFASRGSKGNSFRGRVEPGRVVLQLTPFSSYGYYYADVVEQLESSMYLLISGNVTATLQGKDLPGTLDGALQVFDVDPLNCRGYCTFRAECRSTAHRFVLLRTGDS
jgi:Carboxypeptidase regulatory-like domain